MRKQLLVCDSCGAETDASGATLRLTYNDARKGAKVADLCGGCSDQIPGRPTARRGRKPKQ